MARQKFFEYILGLDNGSPLDMDNFRARVWHPSLRRAGLRHVRLHDCRHSHASMLIAAGADVIEVADRLGHEDPSVTLKTYSHAFKKRSVPKLGTRLAEFRRREIKGLSLALLPDQKVPKNSGNHTEVAGEERNKAGGEGHNRIVRVLY